MATILIFGAEYDGVSQSVKATNWALRADTLFSLEKFHEASKLYSKAIDATKLRNHETLNWFYQRTLCYFSLQDFNLALKDINIVIEQSPKFPSAHILKAFICQSLEDEDCELKNLGIAIQMMVEPSPEIRKWHGLLLLKRGEFEKAKNSLSKAVKFRTDSEIETWLGVCYQRLSQYDSAIIYFNSAIGLNATNSQPFIYAGQTFLEMKDYNMAIKYFNLVLRIDPTITDAIFLKGATLIEMGNVDDGCRFVNRAFYSGYDDATDYLKEYCYQFED